MNIKSKKYLIVIILVLKTITIQSQIDCYPLISDSNSTFSNITNPTNINYSTDMSGSDWFIENTSLASVRPILLPIHDDHHYWEYIETPSSNFNQNIVMGLTTSRSVYTTVSRLSLTLEDLEGDIEVINEQDEIEIRPARYILKFSMCNAARYLELSAPTSAHFNVLIDNNKVASSKNIAATSITPEWHDIELVIVINDGLGTTDRLLSFVAEGVIQVNTEGFGFNSGASPTSPYSFSYLLIDNIQMYKEGECEYPDVLTQKDNSSFSPETQETFVLGAWVKETHTEQPITYTSNIEVSFNDGTTTSAPITFSPSGNIIEGWQRIEGTFTIPAGSTDINVILNNEVDPNAAYFDDIRIHKADGNMKSFVYDPVTQRLMAELDENNYATLYEYDKEGGLVRVKKETEKGVYTIQETRSGNSKLNTQF